MCKIGLKQANFIILDKKTQAKNLAWLFFEAWKIDLPACWNVLELLSYEARKGKLTCLDAHITS